MEKRAELLNLLTTARSQKVQGAEIQRQHHEVLEMNDSRGKAREGEETRWIVTVWKEGRKGTGVAATKEEALEVALRLEEPASEVSGPVERMPIRSAGMGLDDRRHLGIGETDRAEVLHLVERAVAGAPFRLKSLLYRQERVSRAMVSTRGIEAEEFETTYEISAEVPLEARILQHRLASRHFSDIASLPFGTELRRRVEPLCRRLQDAPRLPIVLDPRVMADLFRSLAPAFAADRVANGTSFLSDFLGKPIASPIFHLTDDAGLFGGLLSHSFDDRGVPPIPVTLLKEGVVTSLYHDPETARVAGLRPTGHSREGRLCPSNLIVRPGARTRNVVLSELGSYLSLDRAPTLDLTTGQVEGPLELVVVEKGERKGAVMIPFSASILKILRAVKEVVSDHERSCEVDAPTAVFHPGFGL